MAQRSGCPINLTLEVLGDRWSLIVIRDVMFGNRRHFRELLLTRSLGVRIGSSRSRRLRLGSRRNDDGSNKTSMRIGAHNASYMMGKLFSKARSRRN